MYLRSFKAISADFRSVLNLSHTPFVTYWKFLSSGK